MKDSMKDNNNVSKFIRRNTILNIESLGKIELKSITESDANFVLELSEHEDNDKEFTKSVLYNQLLKPVISFEDFDIISDDEFIDVAREFIQDEYNLSDYFKETEDAEFFKNFRLAIEEYLLNMQKSFIKSVGDISVFTQNYANLIRPMDLSSLIPKSIDLAPIMRSVDLVSKIDYSDVINKSLGLSEALDQVQSTANFLSRIIGPQINFWNNWFDANRNLFDNYLVKLEEFEKTYKIAREEAIPILRRYKWFITPSLPVRIIFKAYNIGKMDGNHRGEMNHLFVGYYSYENFFNLERLLRKWKVNPIFQPRMKIFRDCVSVLKNSNSKTNPSNLVIPTLIAQIDGIQREFMKINEITFKKNGGLKDSRGHGIKWRTWYESLTSEGELLDSANDIFLNILFQDSFHGKPLDTPYTFNRHKIMHGEYYRYGRIDNTIRAFLILDFLAALVD